MILPELLAPAGSEAALHAAVRAGADAVYLGMDAFNARRNAENFNSENICQVCDYAHLRGVKVYITMNTIVLPGEMQDALDCAACAYNAGADAFIVQDIGLMTALRQAIPEARIHASTQMNIHSESGIAAAAELGVARVTLARELSVGEIAHLVQAADALGLQVEAFAHGALCVCYSGQCFMSSMIGGRSANRGLCAQACRLNYDLERADGRQLESPGEFLLSPKDLCSIDILQQLVYAGVSSLKVEGRMKSPEYVQSVISVYREVLDRIAVADAAASATSAAADINSVAQPASVVSTEEERNRLASAFSRGFTTAYLDGERGNEIMSYQRPNNRGQFIGRVKWVQNGKVGIACEQKLVSGDVIEIWTKRGRVALSIDASSDCSASFAEVRLDGNAKVYASDRVFRVRSADAAFKDVEGEPRIPIIGSVRLELGKPLLASFQLADLEDCERAAVDSPIGIAEGPVVEPARSKEVSSEDVRSHIDRLGSTPFVLERLDISLDEGVGIGFSQLHHIRAEALLDLQEKILEPYRLRTPVHPSAISKPHAKGTAKAHRRKGASRASLESQLLNAEIVALATNPDCAHAAKRAGAARIYVPALNYRRGMAEMQGRALFNAGQASYPKHCAIVMPVVSHDAHGMSREVEAGFSAWDNIADGAVLLVQGIGDMQKASQLGLRFEAGPHIPIVNHPAMKAAAAFGADRVWLSPELNMHQIEDLAADCQIPLGLKIFGAQELMTTEHCMLASQGPCNEDCAACRRRAKSHHLRDRKGYEFPVTSDALGRGHIYNSVKLDITPELSQLAEAGVTSFMVDTTLLSAEESAQAVGYCVHALNAQISASVNDGFPANEVGKHDPGRSSPQKRMSNSTSGHLHRGVL